MKDGKKVTLTDVIYAKDLSRNLLSLRKFADQGLQIYLDNKQINIYDPLSRKTVLSGLYKKPFWEIQLNLKDKRTCNNKNYETKSVYVNIVTRSGKVTEGKKICKPKNKTEPLVQNNRLLNTINDRLIVKASDTTFQGLKSSIAPDIEKLKKLNTVMLWHARLGHMSTEYMKKYKMLYPEIKNFNDSDFDEGLRECDVCFRAKLNKLPFKKTRNREKEPLLKIHADVMGYITPVTYPKQYRFIVAFVDSFSRFAMAYPLRNKSDVPGRLKEFIISTRNLMRRDAKVAYLSCDQGTEFTSSATINVLKEFNAELLTVCPATPEHNGVIERFNQTIIKKVRALLIDSGFPLSMWDLALGVAVHIYNQSPHKTLEMKSPLSLIAPNYKFDVNQLKRFGCLTYAMVKDEKKLKDRAIKSFLVGYLQTGYIVYDPETKKFIESREVRFVERYTYGDLYNSPVGLMEELVFSRTDPNKRTREIPKINDPSELTEIEREVSEQPAKKKRGRPKIVKDNEPIVLFSMESNLNDGNSDYKFYALLADIIGDPKTYREALTRPDREKWKEAFGKELNAMLTKNVYQIVKRPVVADDGSKPVIIDTRWVCTTKKDQDGSELKRTRLVARGFRDTNFYNLRETYAPVTRLPLIRLILAFANKHNLIMRQLDVKTAFLNSDVVGEIYVEIPEGSLINEVNKKDYVWKLNKSLYGLKTSPKSWNNLFSSVMTELGFKSTMNEPCLFVYIFNDTIILAMLYVDDIILAGNNERALLNIKEKLMSKFEMKDLGEPKEYLGITIIRDRENKTLKLNQTNFITKLLKRFGYSEAHPQRTPMVTAQVNNRQRRAREGNTADDEVIDQTKYREIVGSLLYLANASRPDICYAVNVVSRHQLNPTKHEWKMIDRILRYLIYTKDLSLTYKGHEDGFDAFSDASLADCKNSITTCGYLVRLFGDAIGWKTKKQSHVALSTCEAEYLAMSVACKELMALSLTVKEFAKFELYPMKMYCDNNAAIASSEIDGGSALRHVIEIRAHYIKECVEKGLVNIKWIATNKQLADIFTKALSFQLHEDLTKRIMTNDKI